MSWQSTALSGGFAVAIIASDTQLLRAVATPAIAKKADSITVRVEGATQGSGVITEKKDDKYTVITAWHVIKNIGPREDIEVYTNDGKKHKAKRTGTTKIKGADLARIYFKSRDEYQTAETGDPSNIQAGENIYVSGFPLATTSVPRRIFRFLGGEVIANSKAQIKDGYQLLYSNMTMPGMSGGAVLDREGNLIGIHGRAETDTQMSTERGYAIKTGTNQGMPITYIKKESKVQKQDETWWATWLGSIDFLNIFQPRREEEEATEQSDKVSGLLAKATQLLNERGAVLPGANTFMHRKVNGNEKEVIKITTEVIAKQPKNYYAYMLRGAANERLQKSGVCEQAALLRGVINYTQSKPFECKKDKAHNSIQTLKAYSDFVLASSIKPDSIQPRINISNLYNNLMYDQQDSIKAYKYIGIAALDDAIKNNPKDTQLYIKRAYLKSGLDRRLDGCKDMMRALSLGSDKAAQWLSPVSRYANDCRNYAIKNIDGDVADETLERLNTRIKKLKQWLEPYRTGPDLYPSKAMSNGDIRYCTLKGEGGSGHPTCQRLDKSTGEFNAAMTYRSLLQTMYTMGTIQSLVNKKEQACKNLLRTYTEMANNKYFLKYDLGFWNSNKYCRANEELAKSNPFIFPFGTTQE
ncbi:trypsin-like peptidase domain protein [Synechococcus sp. Minos11]|uniref:S1 family peptidase n=1 Tax=Synechococcus sp. Minos11 TaxID=221341 RepID=UPI001649526C|nr:serine protease [Synechococcus sp. Minos11]QNJ09998.1 trypsin-like peptidase domain protein [Synechococcus sp. Minos11]